MAHLHRLLESLGLAVILSIGIVSCASASPRARVYVRLAPPAPIVEVRPVAPVPAHVWVAGYYAWARGRYVWVPGRWVAPPRPKAVWVPGHWQPSPRGYYWVSGHWR